MKNELAPSGRLRIGLNYSNFLLVLGDDPSGDPRGIAPDLGRELARRTGLPFEFVKFDAAGKFLFTFGSQGSADGMFQEPWGVAVAPIDPPVGLAVRVIHKAPETRTTHRPGSPLGQGGDPVVATPARG